MTTMELRARITIPTIQFADEHAWEPLARHLEHAHVDDLGPTMSWDKTGTVVTVSSDVADEAELVQRGIDAITESLHATGLGDHYPAAVEVEPAADDEQLPHAA